MTTKKLAEVKARHPGVICLFRVGDFWECYSDDALVVAETLGRGVTLRQDGEETLYMFGFPAAELEKTLRALLAKKHRVAAIEKKY